MQSPSLFLDQSQSLDNLLQDIKSDVNPSFIHPCVASFILPPSLQNNESSDYTQNNIVQPDNILFNDSFDSNVLISSKTVLNDLESPILSICNIDPYQNISQDPINSLTNLSVVRAHEEEICIDNGDKNSLIDELICLFTPSDEKLANQINKNKQKVFNTQLDSINQDDDDFNQSKKINEIPEYQLIEQSINSTVTLTNNSEIIDCMEFNDFSSQRTKCFRQKIQENKQIQYYERKNPEISQKIQHNIRINKKQTLMIKKLRKQITSTISITQKRTIKTSVEEYYEYCWVFGSISCWFSLKSIPVLYDIWLCWANSFIHQKQPLTEAIKGVDRFEELIEKIQHKYEKDPREKIKEQLQLQGYLYSTKSVFKEITLNKALQFNRKDNKSSQVKQESKSFISKPNIQNNLLRQGKKKIEKANSITSNTSKESYKKRYIHPH